MGCERRRDPACRPKRSSRAGAALVFGDRGGQDSSSVAAAPWGAGGVLGNPDTTLAYDRYGNGPTVILVAGALGARKFKEMKELAELLAGRCTVINYDRRGRGDSTEVKPFAVEREIEDIAALVDACGGSASLWGWSSGGALALRAAAAGLGVEKLSVYEVPFMVQPGLKRPTRDYGERLDELVAADDRSGAVKHFMRNAMGIPAPLVALMRLTPMWKQMKATAHTLPYPLPGARIRGLLRQPGGFESEPPRARAR
jgi:pimeloyl-ACP methyl ester carboxylesterase